MDHQVQIYYSAVLGRGGFATVFRGSLNGQAVAVKRIAKINSTEREELLMKMVEHENVLQLLSVEENTTFRYFVLELCTGTLKDYSKRDLLPNRWLSQKNGLYQMARGMQYIHSKGIVHRDIKPDNILYIASQQGVVFKISDFGLAKKTTERGTFSISAIVGTLSYMAPEFLELLDYKEPPTDIRGSQSADTFALGCVFFFYLTKGDHPFGNIVPQITYNIVKGKSDTSALEDDQFRDIIDQMIEGEDSRPDMDQVIELLRITRRKKDTTTPDRSPFPHCCPAHFAMFQRQSWNPMQHSYSPFIPNQGQYLPNIPSVSHWQQSYPPFIPNQGQYLPNIPYAKHRGAFQ